MTSRPIETAIRHLASSGADPLDALAALLDALRPRRADDAAAARRNWGEMLDLLARDSACRDGMRAALLGLFTERNTLAFYSEAGMLPNTGFFSELRRKIAHRVLPEIADRNELKDCVSIVFPEARDQDWLEFIGEEQRAAFWRALDLRALPGETLRALAFRLLDATQVLSQRIGAMGLEPELLRVTPRLGEGESPFIGLNTELTGFVARFRQNLVMPDIVPEDEKHALVLLEQCREVVARARQTAAAQGTSMSLSYLLTRLEQHLLRLELLLGVLSTRFDASRHAAVERWSTLIHHILAGERRHNSVSSHFSGLLGQLALRVTENAARTGEHYIAQDRAEWLLMWRAAAGAGVLIAILALLKILGKDLDLALLNQGLLNGAIYGLGFALVHLLHFVIATKQPAMTAASIAATISQSRGHLREIERLANLAVATLRSQFAAILGNVLAAFPVALAAGLAIQFAGGRFESVEKAHHLLHELDPIGSLALLYAAIAGVWLFVAGLVSGYVDNMAAYSRFGARVARLPWLRRAAGEPRAERIGAYLDQNSGGLAGNLFFGLMLGLTPALGLATGLPLDIRHVAFSSANLAYALVALGFDVDPGALFKGILGVALIGLVNLVVSFTLALWVAMRARGADFRQAAALPPALVQKFRARPASFFIPPKEHASH